MNQAEAEKLLTDVPHLIDVTGSQLTDIEEMLVMPGFKHLLGLMLAARQAQYTILSQQQLGTGEQVARASVTQGKIQGIDMLRHTLLELFTPADADSQGAK